MFDISHALCNNEAPENDFTLIQIVSKEEVVISI